jgi:Protein of unknown function (DUF732)
MKKLVAIGLLLVGCTSTTTDNDVKETVVRATPTTDVAPLSEDSPIFDSDDAFVEYLQDTYPQTRLIPGNTLVETARAVCEALDNGMTAYEMMDLIMQSGTTDEEIQVLTVISGAAVGWYCPEYLYLWE